MTSTAPSPQSVQPCDESTSPEARSRADQVFVASQWQLMWWRFREHKVAVVCTVIVILFYLVALFCEFIATTDPNTTSASIKFLPPQWPRFVDASGHFHLRPFVHGLKRDRDPDTLRITYTPDTSVIYPIYFFTPGTPYKLWGLFDSNIHLFGLGPDVQDFQFHLLGTDRLGEDMWSRLAYGTRISLSIGLIGVILSLLIGIVLGGISGYYGGVVDLIIQRVVEFLRSIPTIPLWMALGAALPPKWPPERIYFGITIILSLLSWTGLARVVRGRFLSLREEDFVLAARLSGTSEIRIILQHMVPSFASHIIASITLSIPGMILSETALSFLGLGLRSPVVSWGVLLQEAQNVQTVALAPWLLSPGLAVVLVILAFNFMGDGLRDAADPYSR
jgi:peptide/nickel transport system permease protein